MSEYRGIPAVPLTAENAADRRALKFEADMAALYRSLHVWRVLYPLFDYPALTTVTPEDSWFVAIELLFWIMDFVSRRPMLVCSRHILLRWLGASAPST